VALLLSGEPMRLPRIKLPLLLFMLGTLIAWAVSPDRAAGIVQIRKFYVFCELLVVFSCLRDLKLVRWLFLTWAGFASIGAIRGVIQFAQKIQLHSEYASYVGERITGFSSHWNTFAAEQMFALIMLAAFLFFAPEYRKRMWVWVACAGLMSFAILIAETRAVWIAMAMAGMYLLWFWKRWMVAALPVAVVLVFLVSPPVIRARFTSFQHPRHEDSNQFRVVTWTTGVRMIEAHPLVGLGPEGPRIHFDQWMPKELEPKPEGSYVHLHNLYLEYAAERGVPTMLMMLWLLVQCIYDFARGLRALPPGRSTQRFVLHGAIAVTLAAMVQGFADYNLGTTTVLTMWLVVAGCGYLALEKDTAI